MVLKIVEGEDEVMLRQFSANSWCVRPAGWRPARPGEVWLASPDQLEQHYCLKRVVLGQLLPGQAEVAPLLTAANPGGSLSGLH
jgi:hypothetical protein